jgi:AmmeMemoRadiSam system protein B
MPTIRKPAVAGMFYPKNPQELQNTILNMLANAKADQPVPKAIIAPHAGYIYSGQTAAKAYACLSQSANKIRRVILLGPSHRYPFQGIAASGADFFATPLGQIKIDQDAIAKISSLPQVSISDEAHAQEHSLEVQLPFLQILLKNFTLIPLVVAASTADQVADVLDKLYNGNETIIIISSDLSHYHDYQTAQQMDKQTVQAILDLNLAAIKEDNACGRIPIKGLMQIAGQKKLTPKLIDLCNSGDTAGHKDKVVGYAAIHFRMSVS